MRNALHWQGAEDLVIDTRYVHPAPEFVERAFEKLEKMNGTWLKDGVEKKVGERELSLENINGSGS